MRSRAKSAKSAKSQFERDFETHQTFKRNKRYVDLEKANNSEQEYSVMRRRPLKSENDHIYVKINSSFLNSTAELTQRIDKEIGKYKSRLISFNDHAMKAASSRAFSTVEPEVQSDTKSRSFSMEKMTSRSYHHELKNKPTHDERLFNNYKEFKPDSQFTTDFNTMRERDLDSSIKHCKDLEYNTQKLYEEYYYSKAALHCKVDYKAERKLKRGRVYFDVKRPENEAATILDNAKIENGRKLASNFKGSNITQKSLLEFYRNSGKELPSQIEIREMTELTNHWKNGEGKVVRKKLDYETRRLKEDMIQKKMSKLEENKSSHVVRSEMCDNKYFRYINN